MLDVPSKMQERRMLCSLRKGSTTFCDPAFATGRIRTVRENQLPGAKRLSVTWSRESTAGREIVISSSIPLQAVNKRHDPIKPGFPRSLGVVIDPGGGPNCGTFLNDMRGRWWNKPKEVARGIIDARLALSTAL